MVDFQAAGSTGTKILGIFSVCLCIFRLQPKRTRKAGQDLA